MAHHHTQHLSNGMLRASPCALKTNGHQQVWLSLFLLSTCFVEQQCKHDSSCNKIAINYEIWQMVPKCCFWCTSVILPTKQRMAEVPFVSNRYKSKTECLLPAKRADRGLRSFFVDSLGKGYPTRTCMFLKRGSSPFRPRNWHFKRVHPRLRIFKAGPSVNIKLNQLY